MERLSPYTALRGVAMAAALWAAGCNNTAGPGYDNLTADSVYTAKPVRIDGILDDEAWSRAPGYLFNAFNAPCLRNGLVRFAWDDRFLYVGARLDDDDIVAVSDRNQTFLFRDGDLFELFLKPVDDTYYWEIYANPLAARASLFIPGGGRLVLDEISREEHLIPDLEVAVQIDGSINHWRDVDTGWSVEIAIPIRELTRYGAKLRENSIWRFFVGRYNYSRYLEQLELSGITEFKDGNRSFHHQPSYGYMRFVK